MKTAFTHPSGRLLPLIFLWSLLPFEAGLAQNGTRCPEALLDYLNAEFVKIQSTINRHLGPGATHQDKDKFDKELAQAKQKLADLQTSGLLLGEVSDVLSSSGPIKEGVWTVLKHSLSPAQKARRGTLTPQVKLGLSGWEKYFQAYQLGNPLAESLRTTLLEKEALLLSKATKSSAAGTSGKSVSDLIEIVAHHSQEEARKSAYISLLIRERQLVDEDFLEIISLRNQIARALGFANFYALRTRTEDGLPLHEVFAKLDAMEQVTREAQKELVDSVASQRDQGQAVSPWNLLHALNGAHQSVTLETSIEDTASALRTWLTSLAALGIDFKQAQLEIHFSTDSSEGNGYIKNMIPSFYNERTDTFTPASAYLPGPVPSLVGLGSLETLLWDTGHFVQSSLNHLPSPSFAIQGLPYSASSLELSPRLFQKIFQSPLWRRRHLTQRNGKPLDEDLLREEALLRRKTQSHALRLDLMHAYFEKQLYEMDDEQRTSTSVLELAREVEKKMLLTEGAPVPLLLQSGVGNYSTSATHHGPLLAELGAFWVLSALHQRQFAHAPENTLGPWLTQTLWTKTNALPLPQTIEQFTQKPFDVAPLKAYFSLSAQEFDALTRKQIELADRLSKDDKQPVDLNALHLQLVLVHEGRIIASTQDGTALSDVLDQFSQAPLGPASD